MSCRVHIFGCKSLKKATSGSHRFSSKLASRTLRTLFLLALSFSVQFSTLIARKPIEDGIITNGDVNRDGYFDLFDLISLERMVALNVSATANELESADVDDNGQLTGFDLLVL